MKEYILSYYPNFKCIAGECKHTCCAGWEMNIDEKSLSRYMENETAFSHTLKKGINLKKSQFKADKSGRCAFLNKDGLCEIIINLGEESLCQVCRDHPRFRSFLTDRIEMGLGFSCEQATRLILSFNGKIEPIEVGCDGKEEKVSFIEERLLEFRKKAIDIVQDRALSASERLNKLLKECSANILEKDGAKIVKAFLSLERLDKAWTKRLKGIKKKPFDIKVDDKLSIYFEQFMANGLYRHLLDAEDTVWVRGITVALALSWWIVQSILEQEFLDGEDAFAKVCDIVRAYSAEVEYSQQNLGKLFSFAYKFVKL